jgi:hypothetical protein
MAAITRGLGRRRMLVGSCWQDMEVAASWAPVDPRVAPGTGPGCLSPLIAPRGCC